MARSTFKVLFYVNGSKEKNGIVPIMGRVTINGTVAQFSCKQSIPKTLWDVKGNRAKGKSMEARDLFIFACFTALSFVDMKELSTDAIVDVNGEKWIISKRYKTNVPFQVKLLDIPLQIIERNKHLSEDKLVFGKINYWTMCKQLKTVIKACGIEKQISYHCARHTFGTLALSKGMPIESVSRVLGHTNIVTTQIYAKITTQKLDNDLTMFGNQLNKSFANITTV